MGAGTADFAILQGLYGSYAAKGEGPISDPQENLRAVSMLWQNVEHFMLDNDLVDAGTVVRHRGRQGRGRGAGQPELGHDRLESRAA